jgi:hypothetical protein
MSSFRPPEEDAMRKPGVGTAVAGLTGVAMGLAVLVAGAGPAQAGRRGCGHGHHRCDHAGQEARYVVVRHPRGAFVRPARADCFMVRRARVVWVRPVPCWRAAYEPGLTVRAGIDLGAMRLGVAFGRGEPLYGCNFCAAQFAAYGAWESHVRGCAHERVVCERWDEADLEGFRAAAW